MIHVVWSHVIAASVGESLESMKSTKVRRFIARREKEKWDRHKEKRWEIVGEIKARWVAIHWRNGGVWRGREMHFNHEKMSPFWRILTTKLSHYRGSRFKLLLKTVSWPSFYFLYLNPSLGYTFGSRGDTRAIHFSHYVVQSYYVQLKTLGARSTRI